MRPRYVVRLHITGCLTALTTRASIICWLLLAALASPARAQVRDTTAAPRDSVRQGVVIPLAGDTTRLRVGAADTASTAPGLPPDTARVPARPSRLRAPVQFAARDRLTVVFDSAGVGDAGTLVGEATATYDQQTLGAEVIRLLFDQNELRAVGVPVDTGVVGRPRFGQGDEAFTSEEIAFNLETERGRFLQARTRLEDGFLKARIVKVAPDSTLFVRGGVYTTCPCVDDPSYSLRSERMKVVDGTTIYTGPIQLYLFNIPTPLWLPFGYLPATEGRRSGLLPPTYGEDERGFYLQRLGWYFPLSRYVDLQLTGSVWSRGSWQLAPRFRYALRYRLSGSLDLEYGRNRSGERTDPDFSVYAVGALRWTHTQTVSPRTSFNANVNLSSTRYLRTASQLFQDRVAQTISSTVAYSTRWPNAGRSLNATVSQTQTLATGAATLSLPNVSFSQSERRPFRARGGVTTDRPRWYETISYSYRSTLDNRYTFSPLSDAELARRGDPSATDVTWFQGLRSPADYRRATGRSVPFDARVTHDLPVTAGFQVRPVRWLGGFQANVNANVTYGEVWYNATLRRRPDTTLTGLIEERVPGFFALRRGQASLSANTAIYGLFPLRVGPFNGLRHTIRPNVGLAAAPDYFARGFGYTRTVTRRDGRPVVYGVVSEVGGGGATGALTFGADNVFETRRVRRDTTGTTPDGLRRTPVTLLNASFSGSYNAIADSFRLSPLSFNARTSLGRFEVSANGSLSPYGLRRDSSGRAFALDRDYLFVRPGFRFARLENFSLQARTRFESRRRGAPRPTESTSFAALMPGQAAGLPLTGLPGGAPYAPLLGAAPYADFSIPWSVSFDATYGLTSGLFESRRFVVNSGFDLSLTPRWKIQGQTGYDVTLGAISTTNLAVLRDFDCWELSFQWIPFGAYTSYGFTLQVKSGKLRELLRLQQPRQDVRGRFGGLIN